MIWVGRLGLAFVAIAQLAVLGVGGSLVMSARHEAQKDAEAASRHQDLAFLGAPAGRGDLEKSCLRALESEGAVRVKLNGLLQLCGEIMLFAGCTGTVGLSFLFAVLRRREIAPSKG